MLTENVASRSHAGPENLDEPSTSQPEMVRNDPLDTTYGLQYNSPSGSSYAISSCTQPNATTYTYPQGNTQMQNLSHLSSLMVIFCPFFCPFSTIVWVYQLIKNLTCYLGQQKNVFTYLNVLICNLVN